MDAKRVTQNMGILIESYRQKAGKIGKITEAWLDELFEDVASALIKQDPAAVLRSDGTTAAAFSCPMCHTEIYGEKTAYCQTCGQRLTSANAEADHRFIYGGADGAPAAVLTKTISCDGILLEPSEIRPREIHEVLSRELRKIHDKSAETP